MVRIRFLVVVVIGFAGGFFSPCESRGDIVYDPALQFDTVNNPSTKGPWTLGWTNTLGGGFNNFTTPGSNGNIFGRVGPGITVVDFNTDTINVGAISSVRWLPGQIRISPGTNGEFGVIRFTAPTTGMYNLLASFSGNDIFAPSTDVYVLVNSVTQFNGIVNTAWGSSGPGIPGAGPSFTQQTFLALGNTVDFAVGNQNGSASFDSTGFTGLITAVPEPNSLIMASIAGVALLWKRRRRLNQSLNGVDQ